ncbi:hypothetical protein B0H11DRAFT_1936491 [Mycena galericulata]|nr:hypothetical protein B0H11DRAFT_1936491 [Mycena galericulata]
MEMSWSSPFPLGLQTVRNTLTGVTNTPVTVIKYPGYVTLTIGQITTRTASLWCLAILRSSVGGSTFTFPSQIKMRSSFEVLLHEAKLNTSSDYQEQLNTSPEVLRAALDRREAEMYHMIQAKEQEAKDAFHRREMELLEAQEKRDEDMRFIRARLEKLVSGSKSTDACKAARSLLNGVKDILHPPAASPMTEVVLTATGEVAVADDDGDHGWKYGAHSRAVCAKQRWGHFFVKDR